MIRYSRSGENTKAAEIEGTITLKEFVEDELNQEFDSSLTYMRAGSPINGDTELSDGDHVTASAKVTGGC